MKEFFNTDIYTYLLKPFIYICLAYMFYKLLTLLINRLLNNSALNHKNKKRIETSKSIIKNIVKYILIIITFLIILSIYHIDVSKIFAGLGIGVAVLSLAFQDIAKDLIAGISILLEDQFEIGDNVSINGFRGEVISMGLKTTRVKDYKGGVQIISNHAIREVINYSLNPSLAIVDLSVSYDSDLDKVEKIIYDTMEIIDKSYPNLKGKTELWGIDKLDDSAIVYRVAVKTKPTKDFEIERKMKKDFRLAFAKGGITIPFPQVEVRNG